MAVTTIHAPQEFPNRANECRELLAKHFNELTSKHPAEVLTTETPLPQGYFMLKNNKVIGWAGLHEKEAVSGKVYGWAGSPISCSPMQTLPKDASPNSDVMGENLTPWITPLLVHPDERGNNYGKLLLEHVCTEAGKLGFKYVYLATGEIGYYEKYGFREVGLTTFTWGRPTKIYEHSTILRSTQDRRKHFQTGENQWS